MRFLFAYLSLVVSSSLDATIVNLAKFQVNPNRISDTDIDGL
jgi:hypothetical protein